MQRLLLIIWVLALSGCFRPGGDIVPSPTGAHFLEDPQEPATPAVYDLLRADFKELNGSLVLELEFRDVYSPRPRLVADVEVRANGATRTYFFRNVGDLDRPPEYIRWEFGRRTPDGDEVISTQYCRFLQSTNPPYVIQQEMLHNQTGLTGGGQITRLKVEVGNFDNETVYDGAEVRARFDVQGGPNPHNTCPMVAERGQTAQTT